MLKAMAIDTKKSSKPHYHGHRQRLRERFMSDPGNFPDYEILELFCYWVYPRRRKAFGQRVAGLFWMFNKNTFSKSCCAL
jgi:hypothetical protein